LPTTGLLIGGVENVTENFHPLQNAADAGFYHVGTHFDSGLFSI
jgi:hypothetical protein